MKLIFLDIDGVLNSSDYESVIPWKSTRENALDPRAVARLNRITDATGAKIVVSSAWRDGFVHTKNIFFEYLAEQGITGEIIDITPIFTNCCRWQEIESWLDDFGSDVEDYIILDDIDSMGDLQDHLVLTTYKSGLLDEHVDIAINKLKKVF